MEMMLTHSASEAFHLSEIELYNMGSAFAIPSIMNYSGRLLHCTETCQWGKAAQFSACVGCRALHPGER